MAGEEAKGGEEAAQVVSEPVVSQDLSDEIDGAVVTAVETVKREREERDAADKGKTDVPPAEVQDGDETGGAAPEGNEEKDDKKSEAKADEPPAITDELVERAVKAGISIADARSFQKADALERMCATLEKRAEGDGATGKKDEGGSEESDPLAAIPDLDPNEYDEKVVAGFKAMKDIIRSQQETIKAIHGEGESRQVSWFEGQIAALGKDYVEAVGTDRSKLDPNGPQAKNVAQLREKFDVLSAGYKAAGKDVSRESVFQEAASIVLGDAKVKAATSGKADELGRRSGQHINRPSGNGKKATTDAFTDVASTLDQKYFGKK